MRRRTATLLAAALLAGGSLVTGAASAGAVTPQFEGARPIDLPGCDIVEEVQLQGSPAHDYMRWETEGKSLDCDVWIQDSSSGAAEIIDSQHISDEEYHHSNWYYDGPGHLLSVCVRRGSDTACGPTN